MNHTDAVARQRSLRSGQSARARITEGELIDIEAITATAIDDGVPPRFAGVVKGSFDTGSLWYRTVHNAVEGVLQPNEDFDGLLLFTSSMRNAGRVAGAIYTGSMVRHRAAKWVNFAEYATMLSEKITIDSNREWDVGDLATWHTELESIRYCYDLLVVHDLRAQLMTQYVATELYKLISARAVRGLYTVLTAQVGQGDGLWTYAGALKSLAEDQFAVVREKVESSAGK